MSTALKYDLSALDAVNQRLEQLAGLDRRRLLDAAGDAVASQSWRRIAAEKRAPDGAPWPAWSERHAKTRHGGHSLLEGEGNLVDSLDYALVGDSAVEIGSNRIYAATHQEGDEGRNIPARAYLGLSGDDEAELARIVDNFIKEALR